jgi:outer membrane receptor protein involved in Fe transport
VTRWNTPTETRAYVQNIAAFVQDAWSPLKWLRLPVGLRFETSSGKATGADNKIRWTTIEPRVGFVVPLFGEKLVLRASWSRYGHLVQGGYLDFGNPNAIGGEVFRWEDANNDRKAQPQELVQLIRTFGGPHSVVDRNLSRPFTDEISFGLEHHLGRILLANARLFRRDTHRIIRLANVGVPLSSYDPVIVIDPGNDGIAGTTDDKPLTLYNEKQTALGKDFLLLANAPDGRGSYKGFELGLSVVAGRGEFSASFAAMKTHAPTNPGNSVFENDSGVIGSLGTDPNTFLFANGRTFFDRAYIGKMTGCYNAPLGLNLGAVAKYYDGLPFGRLLFVEGLNQGPLFVRTTPRAQPGGFRTEFNMTLDVRVSRQFALPRGNLSAYLDFFNLLNLNRNTAEASLTGPLFEMRVPLAVQSPRVAGLGIQWRF